MHTPIHTHTHTHIYIYIYMLSIERSRKFAYVEFSGNDDVAIVRLVAINIL